MIGNIDCTLSYETVLSSAVDISCYGSSADGHFCFFSDRTSRHQIGFSHPSAEDVSRFAGSLCISRWRALVWFSIWIKVSADRSVFDGDVCRTFRNNVAEVVCDAAIVIILIWFDTFCGDHAYCCVASASVDVAADSSSADCYVRAAFNNSELNHVSVVQSPLIKGKIAAVWFCIKDIADNFLFTDCAVGDGNRQPDVSVTVCFTSKNWFFARTLWNYMCISAWKRSVIRSFPFIWLDYTEIQAQIFCFSFMTGINHVVQLGSYFSLTLTPFNKHWFAETFASSEDISVNFSPSYCYMSVSGNQTEFPSAVNTSWVFAVQPPWRYFWSVCTCSCVCDCVCTCVCVCMCHIIISDFSAWDCDVCISVDISFRNTVAECYVACLLRQIIAFVSSSSAVDTACDVCIISRNLDNGRR